MCVCVFATRHRDNPSWVFLDAHPHIHHGVGGQDQDAIILYRVQDSCASTIMYDYLMPDHAWINVRGLSKCINPLDGRFDPSVDDHLIVGRDRVDECLRRAWFDKPYRNPRFQIDAYHRLVMTQDALAYHHAARIAWFVRHRCMNNTMTWPIEIHVHYNAKLVFPWAVTLLDGRHRLAAHVYAYRHAIAAFVTGEPDHVALFLDQFQCEPSSFV